MEASLARVFQSALKTDGGATMGGARGTIVEVTSEGKLKTDGSIRRAASDPAILPLPFSMSLALGT
jgi:membrane protein implicated in regulation of membrane protease activity